MIDAKLFSQCIRFNQFLIKRMLYIGTVGNIDKYSSSITVMIGVCHTINENQW